MITKVSKYVFFGVKEDLDRFYAKAQQEGFIEFIKKGKSAEVLPEVVNLFFDAMRVLKKISVTTRIEEEWSLDEAISAAKRVLHLKEEVERLQEEKRLTEFERARIAPFGDFLPEDLAYIEREGHLKMQFFFARSGKGSALLLSHEELIFVGSEYDLDYFIALNPKPRNYPGLMEMRLEKSLTELYNHLTFVQESIRLTEIELKQFAEKLSVFEVHFWQELNRHHLLSAKKDVLFPLEGDGLFVIEAFVPKTQKARLATLLTEFSIGCEQVKIEKTDREPTVLENEGVNRIGEDLINLYDVPSTTDKDPSGWVFWFFALFFAMIVSDAGYGLLFLGTALYLKWKFKVFTGAAKRFHRLFVILSCFVIGWGVLTASFFGVEVPQGNVLRKIAPLQWLVEEKADYHLMQKDGVYKEWLSLYPDVSTAKDGKQFIQMTTEKPPKKAISPLVSEFSNNILLEFSLIVGIIHIGISLLRYHRRNLAHLGWVIFMLGGYLYFPSMLQATTIVNFTGLISKTAAEAIGLQLIFVGTGAAIFLAMIQKGWSGIKETMNVVQVLGDVLSYVRLYALALASVIMASTFNTMGESVGVVGGVFIILAGHLTTITLGAMSGVVHGLRLNVIEWYRYSFEGGGRAFKPLKILKAKKD